MVLFSIKTQTLCAGPFILRFGAHDDGSNMVYLHVDSPAGGHRIVFKRDGEVLSIRPIFVTKVAGADEAAAKTPDTDAPETKPIVGIDKPAA